MLRICGSLAIAMLLLSACSNQGVRLYGRGSAGGYDAGEFGYAAGGRDLRVIIVGNPFGGDQAAFGRVVTDAMQGRNLGPQTNFTTTPGPSAREIYRVVMVFDPPNGLSADTTCQSDPAALSSTARDGTAVAVLAAFCRSERPLTQIRGDIEAAAGADDPAFVALIGDTTQALFPRKKRKRNRD